MDDDVRFQIDEILILIDLTILTDDEYNFLVKIDQCNEYKNTNCYIYYCIALIIKFRNLSCIDNSIAKLTTLSQCVSCDFDFVKFFEKDKQDYIYFVYTD